MKVAQRQEFIRRFYGKSREDQEKELVTISPNNEEERSLLTNKLTELESSLKYKL